MADPSTRPDLPMLRRTFASMCSVTFPCTTALSTITFPETTPEPPTSNSRASMSPPSTVPLTTNLPGTEIVPLKTTPSPNVTQPLESPSDAPASDCIVDPPSLLNISPSSRLNPKCRLDHSSHSSVRTQSKR